MLIAVSMFVFVSFGYAQQTMLLTESFETGSGTTPPAGWAIEQVTGTTPGISFVTTSTYPTITAAYDGTRFVQYNSFNISSGSTRLKRTAAVSTVNKSFIMVDFAWYEDPGYSSSADKVDVQWSTDGTTWNTAGTFNRYNAVAGWKGKNVVLPTGAANQATLYVAFLFTTAYGNNCAMDFVHVTAGPPPPPALVVIGTGTATAAWPYYTFYWSSRTQMLYTAAELTAAGAIAGPLQSIGFNIASAATQPMNNFAVKMTNTTLTSLTGWVAGLPTNYSGTYTVPGTGWRDITLTTPHNWNGTSNVIVEVCFANSGYTSNSTVYSTAMTGMNYHYHADNSTGCAHTSSSSGSTPRPNIRFGVPPVSPGVLMGYVRDVNTSAPIAGAIVQVGALRDTSRANGMYVIYNIPAGAVTALTTVNGYINNSSPATIVSGAVTNLDIMMSPGPKVGGVVTDASNGNPITGATIKVGGTIYTMTVAGGSYLTPLLSIVGPTTVEIAKTGYDPMTFNVILVANSTFTQDAALLPTANQPGPFTAALNTGATAVNLNWGVPQGMYQLIYDDGIQDNFAIWANANNLNAMKFTPVGWPAKLVGGKVNLGVAANYPSNALPLAKFMMMVAKADGAGGTPGTIIDSIEVTPTGFGWADFSFSVPITINSGDFFLVMRQGGIPPHAAGLGVDLTNTQLRSWSKFVTGGAPWVPAAGNFMIRAIMQGTGGPMDGDNASTGKQLITASMPNGLIYEAPVATQTGYEGVARTEPFEWSSLLNTPVSPMQTNLKPYTGKVSPKADLADVGEATGFIGGIVPVPDAPAATLYDNGPMVNSPGTGAGGADESMLQNPPINSFGFNMINGTYRMADDFAVSGGSWSVSSLEFYGYQTGSTTTSSFTGAYVRIFQGTPGGTVTTVWGDNTTNRLTSTTFSNIYRVSVTGNTQRPIMKIVVNTPGLTLQPGSYWIEFSATGSLASGPWCPMITINNTFTTGNALIYVESTSTYEPYEVGAAAPYYAQGIPFKLFGTVNPIVGNMTYQVWRLNQGQEGNQAAWTSIWTGNVNTTVDNSWPSLPDGAYRWAVKAIYSPPGQRPSAPTFSNVLGKNWIANVDICVSLTCAANPKAGTLVKLINVNYPDTVYTQTTDTSGCVHFANVWKGDYTIQAIRFTYPVYSQNVTIMGDANYNIVLLQETAPPTNLAVNDENLKATWSPPRAMVVQLNETWASGNFTANQWVEEPSTSNWATTTGFGNPAPSAVFNYSPTLTNYNQYLTSKTLAGIHAPIQRLKYDIYLSNFSTATVETLAVELWNGTTWTVLKTYQNNGNIPWTSENLDISSVTHNPAFKIRFHVAGANSFNINNWNIDNIQVYSTDGTSGPNPCVIGYNFYLNGVLSAFTPDTTYNIPPNQVVYGQTYQACVKAIYGSGYSAQICVNFTAHFLYPARDLTAEDVPECNAYLTWLKPVTMGDAPDFHVPAFKGVVEHTPANSGRAPLSVSNTIFATQSDQPLGANAFGINMSTWNTINFDVNNVAGMTNIGPLPNTSDFWHDLEMPANQVDFAYGIRDASDHLYKVVRATGAFTDLGSMGNTTADVLLDLAIDGSNGDIYGVSSNAALTADKLWKINPAIPSATLIGSTVNSAGMISLAGDKLGNLWGYDLVNDQFFSVNKTTGVATAVGPLGFNANYGQCMFFDEITNMVTMAAYNFGTNSCEIRTVDVTTGASIVISSTPNQIGGATLPVTTGGGGGGTPPGLIGYNIYRDGAFIHYNPHPDSVTYYDYNLAPATYKYEVKAKYDLSVAPYGLPPGTTGLSLGNTAGEQSLTVICGRPLPFYEPWDLGTFTFNNWSFEPTQEHWSVNAGLGNPAPSADFIWSPAIANYSKALVSPVIDATPWTCAKIWLDVDLKLVDRNMTGKEKLTVDLFYNGTWHQKLEVVNNGSTDWLPKHIDISVVKGKAFKIRFNATGVNSADMLHWYVDNVHAYGICNAAKDLDFEQSHHTTTLTWTAPECVTVVPTQLKKLFQWSGTPDNGYFQSYDMAYGVVYDLATYPDAALNKIDYHHASWGTTGTWQYNIHVVDWATYTEIANLGPFSTTGNDIWENNVPLGNIPGVGGKMIGIMLEPLSNSPTDAYPCFSADNVGPDGVSMFGALPDFSSFGASGIGDFLQNLWIEIPAGDQPVLAQPRKVTVKELQTIAASRAPAGITTNAGFLTTNQMTDSEVSDSSVVTGYDVYRTNELGVNFAKLAGPITATTYVDTYPPTTPNGSIFKYYVTVVYKNSDDNEILCEPSSDTITVPFFPVGLNELTNGQIMIYPNPATEVVNVKSDYSITRIDVMNFVGQTIYTNSDVAAMTAKLNVSTFKTGVYFVKVSTSEGVRTVKITVTH